VSNYELFGRLRGETGSTWASLEIENVVDRLGSRYSGEPQPWKHRRSKSGWKEYCRWECWSGSGSPIQPGAPSKNPLHFHNGAQIWWLLLLEGLQINMGGGSDGLAVARPCSLKFSPTFWGRCRHI